MFKLIVLDRDGVVNEDSPLYIKSPDEWYAIAGSIEAIVKLQHHGYKVAIATNQSGIARHYFTADTVTLIHKKMIAEIEAAGGYFSVDDIFICPHGPEDNCECRKPKPGLLLRAARHFNVDPTEMLIIGDSMRDIVAAKACGAAAILVKTGKGRDTLRQAENIDVPVCADLAEAVDLFVVNN
jgi:D-glycero-D-manno-heptose 1,7-bisphosphate phosphatase